MQLQSAADIAAAVFALFVWTADVDQYGVMDDRRSHAEAVIAGRKFRDDCDGFAITAVDLMRRAKVPSWVVIVTLPFDQGDHMVAVYVSGGETWALDNRQAQPVLWADLRRNSMYRIR
jgi:transglutaminase-like putative cysteine protease